MLCSIPSEPINGLSGTDQKNTISRVPFLGNIPILGHLLRGTITDTLRIEVTVFLAPYIPVAEQ
ncbi:MAG: hypothetical protein V1800_17465 [Candidatus Latescibacterota bacterium]